MYIACRKCQMINTTSLYPIRRLGISNDENFVYKGSFSLFRHVMSLSAYTLEYKNDYITGVDCFLDPQQLKYSKGWGCCGNYGKPIECLCCGSEIGVQYLDCVGMLYLQFFEKKTVRKYKK